MTRSLLAVAGLLVPAVSLAAQSTLHAGHTTPTTLTIAMHDYAFEAPETVPAGWVTLKGVPKGKELHEATLIRLEDGKRLTDLVEAMKQPGPPPAWMVPMGGPLMASEVTIHLAPGRYVWWCFIPSADGVPHFAKGMVKEFVVHGTAPSEAAPKADVTVTMKDYAWDFSTPLTAGKHTLKVVNAPGQPHQFILAKLRPGKTAMQVAAFSEKPSGEPPFTGMWGTVAQATGDNYLTVDLAPGRYAVICFLPDGKDGKAHLEHGMITEIEVK